MSRENVEIARRSLMTWRKDHALDWSLAHDDMEVEDHLIDMGEYRGRARSQALKAVGLAE